MGEVLVQWENGSLRTSIRNCWQHRGENMEKLLSMAVESMSEAEKQKIKNFTSVFVVNDHGDGEYTICSDRYTDRTLPCFAFDHWKEAKIDDYTEMCEAIVKRSSLPHKFDKLFWAGQVSHRTRKIFIDRFSSHPKMELVYHRHHWGHFSRLPSRYTTLPDHCDYKYMLDLQGNGYSARVKFLLHTKRPLFYQQRKFHEYWFWSLEPFVHYIPVKEDLSDFQEMFDWAEKNPKKCSEIANNAYDFATSNLKRSDAVQRMKNILLSAKNPSNAGELWEFYSEKNGLRRDIGIIRLDVDGRIRVHNHFNEKMWKKDGESIVFMDGNGNATSFLEKKSQHMYSGAFLKNNHIRHSIKKIIQ